MSDKILQNIEQELNTDDIEQIDYSSDSVSQQFKTPSTTPKANLQFPTSLTPPSTTLKANPQLQAQQYATPPTTPKANLQFPTSLTPPSATLKANPQHQQYALQKQIYNSQHHEHKNNY